VLAELAVAGGLHYSTALLKLLPNLSPGTISTPQERTDPLLRTEYPPSRFGDLRCRVVPSTLGFQHSAGFNYFNKLFLAIIAHNNDALKVVLARGGTPYLPLLPCCPPYFGSF
jgi:hypothetical protein